MKKISKKVISLILSVLMVASVLPSFAVTALADTNDLGLVAEYFVDSDLSKDNTGNGNTMTKVENVEWATTWMSDRDGAYFNNLGTSIALKNDLLKNTGVTAETGFSISFYGFKYATGNWRRFIDLCNGTDSYTFITASGLVGMKEPGTGDRTNLASGKESADTTWNKYLLTCDLTGAKVYRDGELIAQASYENNTSWLNAMINGADLQVGVSAFSGDEKLDGVIRELRVYDRACTPADLDSASVENYINNRIERAIPETFTAQAWHGTSVANGAYSNVVWHAYNQTAWGDAGSSVAGFKYNKIDMPNNLVLAYDGVNDVTQPVVFEWKTDGNSYMQTLFPRNNEPDLTEFRSWWHGYTDADWNAFNYNTDKEFVGYAPYQDKKSGKQDNKNTTRFMYNKLYYKGTGNTDTYYDIIQNLNFDLYAGNNGNDGSYWDNDLSSKGLSYVLNYKPVYDILSTKDYATAIANKQYYTVDSFNAFYDAVKKVATLDVNGYFENENGSTVEANVIAAANAIKTTVNAYNTAKDSLVCTHNYGKVTVNNVTTYTCSVCGDSYTVDKTALASAITEAETVKADKEYDVKYTSTSKHAFETALASAKTALADEEITQADVNTATSNLTTAKNGLAAAKYSVTVNVINADTDDIIGGDYDTVAYGKEYKYYYVIPAEEGKDTPAYVFYKWTKTVGLDTTRLNNTDTSLDEVVKGDVEYNLYLLPSSAVQGDSETSTTTRVRFLDKANRTIDISTAEQGATITAEEFGIEAPAVAFYNFARWECVYGNPDQVGITEVVFKAVYTFNNTEANMCNIVSKDASVKVNGAASAKVGYDTLVALTGADAYAYCDAEGNIISAINGTTIYAPHKTTIYVTKVETAQLASATVTGYFCSETKMQGATPYKTLTVNSQYYVPAEATASECGIMVSRNGDKWTKVKSTAQGTNHEYSIAMNYSSPYTLKVKAYVVVGEDTFESDVEEIQLDAID